MFCRWETTLSPASDQVSAVYFIFSPFKFWGVWGLTVKDSLRHSYASSLPCGQFLNWKATAIIQCYKTGLDIGQWTCGQFLFSLSLDSQHYQGATFQTSADRKDEKEASFPSRKGIFPFTVIIKHISHLDQSYILLKNNTAQHGNHIKTSEEITHYRLFLFRELWQTAVMLSVSLHAFQ